MRILAFFYLRLLACGLITLMPLTNCWSQDSIPTLDEIRVKWQVQHSLVHWLDPVMAGPHVSVIRQIKNRQHIRAQVGYLLKGSGEGLGSKQLGSGFRVRLCYRKYRKPLLSILNKVGFWDVQLDYRYYDALLGEDFERGGGTFFQRINYNVWSNALSLNFIVGTSLYISDHFRLELGVGLGARYRKRAYSDLPEDARQVSFGNLFWSHGSNAGEIFRVNMPIHFSIGYCW